MIQPVTNYESEIRDLLEKNGPVSTPWLLAELQQNKSDDELARIVKAMINCPGTWIILIGGDSGLIGLDGQSKPGNGTEADAAEFLDLVWMPVGEGLGYWTPKPIA